MGHGEGRFERRDGEVDVYQRKLEVERDEDEYHRY